MTLRRTAAMLLLLLMLAGLFACGEKEAALPHGGEQTTVYLPTETQAITSPVTAAPTTATAVTPPSTAPPATKPARTTTAPTAAGVREDGEYTSRDEVALYIHLYGHLPGNFITKSQAQALGWSGGSLERYAPGKSIGGDRFGNYEKRLPAGKYTECDIDTRGAASRGAKRLVFSSDGRIYYTEDHYETFTQLYGGKKT